MLHRRIWICPFALLLVFALAACGGDAAQPTPDPLDPALLQQAPPTDVPLNSSTLPTASSGEALVATVNGQPITLAQFERAISRRQTEFAAASVDALRAEVLGQLIEQMLIDQGAAAQNIVISAEQVQAEIQSMVEQAGGQENYESWLASNLYTPDEFSAELRGTLLTNQVRDALTADLGGNVQQVNARHILLTTAEEAQSVLARLNAGEDFAALAQTLSRDETTRASGGDLGWFTQEELLVPELAQAAFTLQPGQIAGPIGTSLGYHVVQTIEVADRPVDEERRVFIAQARFENWLRPLLDNAVIERYLPS